MTDPMFYSNKWAAQVQLADCPSCKGTKRFNGKPCRACRAIGLVEKSRTCGQCGDWLAACLCPKSVEQRKQLNQKLTEKTNKGRRG